MKAADHHARLRELGCILCIQIGYGKTPPEIHHIGDNAERDDMLVIPLCLEHHRGATGFHGLGERKFNAAYKTSEIKLLAKTLGLL